MRQIRKNEGKNNTKQGIKKSKKDENRTPQVTRKNNNHDFIQWEENLLKTRRKKILPDFLRDKNRAREKSFIHRGFKLQPPESLR